VTRILIVDNQRDVFEAPSSVRKQTQPIELMKDLLMDVCYALRVLWKSPAFTLVALVTLTLRHGSECRRFGVVNAVLLHTVGSERTHKILSAPHAFVD